jgi:hypothetical protein
VKEVGGHTKECTESRIGGFFVLKRTFGLGCHTSVFW